MEHETNVGHITAKLDFATRGGKKKILIVLNAVAAAYSAIKGSAIKGSEAANGEEVFLRETLLLSRFSQANVSMSTSTQGG